MSILPPVPTMVTPPELEGKLAFLRKRRGRHGAGRRREKRVRGDISRCAYNGQGGGVALSYTGGRYGTYDPSGCGFFSSNSISISLLVLSLYSFLALLIDFFTTS